MPRPKGIPKTGGRQKGTPNKVTLDKAILREQVYAHLLPHLSVLLDAQVANAGGLKYLVTRDKKTGKFIRVGPAMAERDTEETIEVWEKDPSVQAFTDLMNRLLDKPKEQVQEHQITGDVALTVRLQAGQKRVAEARGERG